MKEERFSRHLLIAFLLSVVLYVAGYWFIESRRTTQTPWVVSFELDQAGQLNVDVRQDSMNLGPVRIQFESPVTNSPSAQREVVFDAAKSVPFALPVGKCIFQDTTFLPGTVVLEIAGANVQMLPRALTVGTNEFSWDTKQIVIPVNGAPFATP